MRKLIAPMIGLAAAIGCHSAAPSPAPAPSRAPAATGVAEVGAPDALGAVRAFLDAAKAQDLQAMAAIFGDKDGAARDRIPREELEKREIIMACYLKHDSFDVVGDAPTVGDARVFAVKLSLGPLARTTNFQTERGPAGRWFVRMFDTGGLQDLCAYKPR